MDFVREGLCRRSHRVEYPQNISIYGSSDTIHVVKIRRSIVVKIRRSIVAKHYSLDSSDTEPPHSPSFPLPPVSVDGGVVKPDGGMKDVVNGFPPWLYDGGLKDGGDSTGFSQNLYAQKKGGCSNIWNSVVNAWLWIQIGLISCVKVYAEGELYDRGLNDGGNSNLFSQNQDAEKIGCSKLWKSVVNAWLWFQMGIISCVKVYTEGELYDAGLNVGGNSNLFSQNQDAEKIGCSKLWKSVVNAWLWFQMGIISCVKVYTEGELYDTGLKDDGVLKEDGGLKGDEGSIGCLQKQYNQKIGCWSKIWRSVVYAISPPPLVWLQIGVVSYVMAHSETELYGLVVKGIWKRMKWWRKPAALSVEWCGRKFVWYYKYIRYVSKNNARYVPSFISGRLGKARTVFWLAFVLRALSLAIPLTILVSVWNMFCFLVKVVSGWFLMMLNLESF